MNIHEGTVVHKKTGNLYFVESEVINSTNGINDGQKMVLYRSLNDGSLYVREEKEFWDKFVKVNIP